MKEVVITTLELNSGEVITSAFTLMMSTALPESSDVITSAFRQ